VLNLNKTSGGNLIANGGTLSGNGIVIGNLNVTENGTIAPGNSSEVIKVGGNLNIDGIYNAQVDSTQSSKIQVDGAATLNSSTSSLVISSSTGTYAFDKNFPIIQANRGLIGTFAKVSIENLAIVPLVTYDDNDVHVKFRKVLSNLVTTPNQLAITTY